jgi:hypothetical protein
VNHIMFRYVSSRFIWAVVKEGLRWQEVPVSLEDYIANWLDGRRLLNNMLMLFRLGAVCWLCGKLGIRWLLRRK